MKIVVDAMGGDHGPSVTVEGSIRALREKNNPIELVLTGDKNLITKELNKANFSSPNLTVYPTTQMVSMSDKPSQVPKLKSDSSLVAGIRLVQEGKCDAFVSAGSTGAILSTALFVLGRIEGVLRPALGAYIPVKTKGFLLCDVGANVEVKPQHLLQFATMAIEYMEHVRNVSSPSVALLNVGAEPTKGPNIYKEAHKIMSKYLPSFKGNIEGRYLLDGQADIVICDGFLGNNLIKFTEGWVIHLSTQISKRLKEKTPNREEIGVFEKVFSEAMREFDYEEYGGVPLLGINGICIVCHGASGPRALKNGIFSAIKCVEEKLVQTIHSHVANSMSALDAVL